jgi:hypothetical protein
VCSSDPACKKMVFQRTLGAEQRLKAASTSKWQHDPVLGHLV